MDHVHSDDGNDTDDKAVAHPVPHPGCTACDPAFMRSRLAHAGFPRRVRRPVQLVAIEPGGPVIAVFGKGAR